MELIILWPIIGISAALYASLREGGWSLLSCGDIILCTVCGTVLGPALLAFPLADALAWLFDL